ncbi:MAG: tRNA 2-thiouridine(34) synthase MnmA [Sphingomonadales bacterium]
MIRPWKPGQPNFLGFDRAPGQTRVVVAMSGGVDSSVTAALLCELGFEVIGITLQLYDHGVAIQKKGACCAGQDIHDARRVAEKLGVPHYVLDYESRFRDAVMENFADSYLKGETPVPCITCNQTVKFRDLLDAARDLGADCMATGHYIRSEAGTDGRAMFRAVDRGKDQSYFLFATTAEQLDYLRFPLGGLEKTEVRELARRYDLPVAAKPESQDICFVPNGNYAAVIERLRPGAGEPGDIIHLDGRVLGRHKGIINFTIGQRRGLGIGGTVDPLYVVGLDPAGRRVIVGPREALLTASLSLRDMNWLGGAERPGEMPVQVRVRNTQEPVGAVVRPGEDGGTTVTFDEPEAGVSPGQACVLYDGERVLGGGWIASAQSSLVGASLLAKPSQARF